MAGRIRVEDYLTRQIEISEKTQKQIANEAGYEKPNVLSMMKKGIIKVPIERAPALARALNVDPAHFLRMVLREYMQDAWAVMEEHLGGVLSENERRLLELYRAESGDDEIELNAERLEHIRAALRD